MLIYHHDNRVATSCARIVGTIVLVPATTHSVRNSANAGRWKRCRRRDYQLQCNRREGRSDEVEGTIRRLGECHVRGASGGEGRDWRVLAGEAPNETPDWLSTDQPPRPNTATPQHVNDHRTSIHIRQSTPPVLFLFLFLFFFFFFFFFLRSRPPSSFPLHPFFFPRSTPAPTPTPCSNPIPNPSSKMRLTRAQAQSQGIEVQANAATPPMGRKKSKKTKSSASDKLKEALEACKAPAESNSKTKVSLSSPFQPELESTPLSCGVFSILVDEPDNSPTPAVRPFPAARHICRPSVFGCDCHLLTKLTEMRSGRKS
jgi:hypothetical protein